MPGLIERAIDHPAPDVRLTALVQAGRLRLSGCIPKAIQCLADETKERLGEVRLAAVEMLGRIGDEHAAQTFVVWALDHPGTIVGSSVAEVASRHPEAVSRALVTVLTGADANRRFAAARALASHFLFAGSFGATISAMAFWVLVRQPGSLIVAASRVASAAFDSARYAAYWPTM